MAGSVRLRISKAKPGVKRPWLSSYSTHWEVLEDYTAHGITVPVGYVFDGSSVPRWFWWLYPPTYAPAWEASCVHDYCYSHYYLHIDKKSADKLLIRIMEEHGASKLSCKLFYLAVRANRNGGNWERLNDRKLVE